MGHLDFTDEMVLAVWRKGKAIPGYNPNKYRQDSAGAWMAFADYGNTNSDYGWEIDHIIPLSKGGSNNIDNLQPMQWENNRSKGDNYPFYHASVTSRDNRNVYA